MRNKSVIFVFAGRHAKFLKNTVVDARRHFLDYVAKARHICLCIASFFLNNQALLNIIWKICAIPLYLLSGLSLGREVGVGPV